MHGSKLRETDAVIELHSLRILIPSRCV